MDWVQIASGFGFPAVFAVLLFVTYRDLVSKLVEVVQANTEQAKALTESHRALCDRVGALEGTMARTMGDRRN